MPTVRRSARLAAKPRRFYYEVTETGRPAKPYGPICPYPMPEDWDWTTDDEWNRKYWDLYNSEEMRSTWEPHWTKTTLPRWSPHIAAKAIAINDPPEHYTFPDMLIAQRYNFGYGSYLKLVPINDEYSCTVTFLDAFPIIGQNYISIIRSIAHHCGVRNYKRAKRSELIHAIAHY